MPQWMIDKMNERLDGALTVLFTAETIVRRTTPQDPLYVQVHAAYADAARSLAEIARAIQEARKTG